MSRSSRQHEEGEDVARHDDQEYLDYLADMAAMDSERWWTMPEDVNDPGVATESDDPPTPKSGG